MKALDGEIGATRAISTISAEVGKPGGLDVSWHLYILRL
jgi:hypothetical protein